EDASQARSSSSIITGCTFVGNVAAGGQGGGIGNGGALMNEGLGSTMSLSGSTVIGNTSRGGDGGDGSNTGASGQALGGGVLTVSAQPTIRDSAIPPHPAARGAASSARGGELRCLCAPPRRVIFPRAAGGRPVTPGAAAMAAPHRRGAAAAAPGAGLGPAGRAPALTMRRPPPRPPVPT